MSAKDILGRGRVAAHIEIQRERKNGELSVISVPGKKNMKGEVQRDHITPVFKCFKSSLFPSY